MVIVNTRLMCPIAGINWLDRTTKAAVVAGASRRVGFLHSYFCSLVRSAEVARLASFG